MARIDHDAAGTSTSCSETGACATAWLRRLEGCTDWEGFETTLQTRPVLGGLRNVDSFARAAGVAETAWEALTLRLFAPETRSWSIWWAATSEPGRL